MTNAPERAASVRAILAMGEGGARLRAVVEILAKEIEQLERDTAELRGAVAMCRKAVQARQGGEPPVGRMLCH